MGRKPLYLDAKEIDLLLTVIDRFSEELENDSRITRPTHAAAGAYVSKRLVELRGRLAKLNGGAS